MKTFTAIDKQNEILTILISKIYINEKQQLYSEPWVNIHFQSHRSGWSVTAVTYHE